MNILILNWKDIKNPEVGGAEVIAFELARRLVKDGHAVTFFTRSFTNTSTKEIIDGVTIIRKGNKLSVYIHAFFYYRSLKNKPDRVIDMVNTLCWQTPLYVPKDKRVAYVNQLAKEVLFYQFPWPLSWVSYFLERFEYLPYKSTRFICYSKSTKQDLIDFGINKNNIQLFPLGINHKRYITGGKKTTYALFIFVARLVKMKRPKLCIEAFKKVVKKYPNAKIFIIGNGPEEESLQNYIDQSNLRKQVILVNKNNFFIDKTIKDVKVKYMQEAWMLLLPSVKEGWGMVVTEAAACGTPAIVSDVTGLRDSVIKNRTGIVLSANPSPDELAKAMIKIISDKKLLKGMAKEAIDNAKDYTWERSYDTFKKNHTKLMEFITLKNQNNLIEGIYLHPLKVNEDETGILVETLRKDWQTIYNDQQRSFAMQYYSKTNSAVARDEDVWHYHPTGQEDRFLVVEGRIVVAVADNRDNSPTKGHLNLFLMDAHEDPYILLIPKQTLHGFMVVSDTAAILLNYPTRLYDPKEEGRIPYAEAQVKMPNGELFTWNAVRTALTIRKNE